MNGRIYFILGSSFVMGVLSGAFLYATVFAPEYQSTGVETVDPESIVIEGQMYGGCMLTSTCSSFRLLEDRTYSYLETPKSEVKKGRLSSQATKEIFNSIESQQFLAATTQITSTSCNSHVDGIDYTYTITYEQETYILDTCTSSFARNVALQNLFLNLWEQFKNPTSSKPSILEEGISGAVKKRLLKDFVE